MITARGIPLLRRRRSGHRSLCGRRLCAWFPGCLTPLGPRNDDFGQSRRRERGYRGAALALLAIVLGALPTAAFANNAAAQIEALEAHFAAAVKAKDVAAIMRFYVPGRSLVVFDVAPPREYVGAAAYRKNWEGFFATVKGPIGFTIGDLHVGADHDLAYSRSIQHVTGTDTRGRPFDLTVRVTDIYRRIAGHWLIEHEHVSVPVNLETDKPDFASKP